MKVCILRTLELNRTSSVLGNGSCLFLGSSLYFVFYFFSFFFLAVWSAYVFFFFLISLLEYNCFTMLCQSLLYNKVNQLYGQWEAAAQHREISLMLCGSRGRGYGDIYYRFFICGYYEVMYSNLYFYIIILSRWCLKFKCILNAYLLPLPHV